MTQTLIALAKLLDGQLVYAGSEMEVKTVRVLEDLSREGELIESREGNVRWWSVRANCIEFIREQSKRS